MLFTNFDGVEVDIASELIALKNECGAYDIYIGSDSQVEKSHKRVRYATVVVFHRRGKGGRIFKCTQNEPYEEYANLSLRGRLMRETWSSIEVSLNLLGKIPGLDITVHIDVNESDRFASGSYWQELVGMVVGQGFKCKIKPDSWCAHSVADKFTK